MPQKKTPQEKFVDDVNNYITSHPYYKNQTVIFGNLTKEVLAQDLITHSLPDPDGAYEEVKITIDLIP